MRWFDKDLEIRYGDTDAMGVVHHSVYALYCEIGRTWLCEAIHRPYHEMEEEGIYFMVADMYGRFKAPVRYGMKVYVRSRISRLKKRLLVFDYEIRERGSEELLYTGYTKHIITRRTDGPMSLPDQHLAVFEAAMDTEN